MLSRRPFLIASLDDAEEAMFSQFLKARDDGLPSPLRFFKPAYAAHVDKWGFPEINQWSRTELTDDLVLKTTIYPKEITEASYVGSKQKWQEIDECSQWVPLWAYKKADLKASINKLLKMDAQFDEDYKKLLEWLKTRGKPFYLTGGEYHNLTNPRAYRHGLIGKARRYMEMISASFKTY